MGHLEGWGVGPPVIENIIVAASTVGKPTVVQQHSSVYNQMVLPTALRALSAGEACAARTENERVERYGPQPEVSTDLSGLTYPS